MRKKQQMMMARVEKLQLGETHDEDVSDEEEHSDVDGTANVHDGDKEEEGSEEASAGGEERYAAALQA